MLRYADSPCTNPRDKIFALLSLVPKDDPGRRLVEQNLDYALSALDFIRRTIQILGELHADSAAGDVDMPFWVRRMLVWFEGDANLEQEISRFMLLGSSVPSLDAPKLEVSIKSWVRLRPAAADSMLLPGFTSRLASASSPGYARRFNLLHHVVDNQWAFLSSRFVVSTQVDASPAPGDDFVARPALPGEKAEYKMVEKVFEFRAGDFDFRYYLVSVDVTEGDILASVRWSRSTYPRSASGVVDRPDVEALPNAGAFSVSYAILRPLKPHQPPQFHSWALPLRLQETETPRYFGNNSQQERFQKALSIGRHYDREAHRFFHPQLHDAHRRRVPWPWSSRPSSSRDLTFSFSLGYPHRRKTASVPGWKQMEVGSSIVDKPPMPPDDMRSSEGESRQTSSSAEDGSGAGNVLRLGQVDVLRLLLAESHYLEHLHPQGQSGQDADSDAPPFEPVHRDHQGDFWSSCCYRGLAVLDRVVSPWPCLTACRE